MLEFRMMAAYISISIINEEIHTAFFLTLLKLFQNGFALRSGQDHIHPFKDQQQHIKITELVIGA